MTKTESSETRQTPAYTGQERLMQNRRTAGRIIDGKAVVIAIDQRELHILNSVGSRVWELADGRSLTRLVDDIVKEFDVERSRALSDVCRFVGQLERLGALDIETGQA